MHKGFGSYSYVSKFYEKCFGCGLKKFFQLGKNMICKQKTALLQQLAIKLSGFRN